MSDTTRDLILVNHCSPGDVLMLTAAVRDLHAAHPGRFRTAVETQCPDLWLNNPHVTAAAELGSGAMHIECHQPPLLNRCNEQPRHYIEAAHDLLSQRLDVNVPLTRFAPDVHLTQEEMAEPPCGVTGRYWLIVAGGKQDVTVKWWPGEHYQRVVDALAGAVRFVQVGGKEHHHVALRGVVNLVGDTSLRELVQLVYHSDGVVCPVTCAMHLAAAFDKPCVVIAGGREPPHWEMYPTHQFLHTIGQLPCCRTGGCWRARVVALNDGDAQRDGSLCDLPVNGDGVAHAKCMVMIEPGEVIGAVRKYLIEESLGDAPLSARTARRRMERAIDDIPPYPGDFAGRGVVICGGGRRLLPAAWVCINMLRRLGCELPIELWHLGPDEMDDRARALLAPLNVRTIDAYEQRRRHPMRILNGWELKPFALVHSSFEQMLYLDADNVPVVDPTFLFDTDEYKETGALFWPDYGHLMPKAHTWRMCGLVPPSGRDFESGQIVLDKRRCWRPLWLTRWMNEHSDFWYTHMYGDKNTFLIAWRKLAAPYALVPLPIETLRGTMCQHDIAGRRIFQHRNTAKWTLDGENPRVQGFQLEDECLGFLRELGQAWPAAASASP